MSRADAFFPLGAAEVERFSRLLNLREQVAPRASSAAALRRG